MKILIANRGEIAVRILRACREMQIPAVAVYSDADRLSPHVLMADEAIPLGPAPAAQSYLNQEKLLEAARHAGADTIHPGYGFLAENAGFARRVEEAGLDFVGPPAAAIGAMADKPEARRRMEEAGVPVIPGSREPLPDREEAARRAAEEIGYPVMLKAAAGGGGKGMRVVREAAEIASAFRGARREAGQAFGDERVYLERYLPEPRHIEIQILADAAGRTVSLGERECSVQRRHQKLIEEAPSPAVDADLRQRMGRVAVAAAEAVGYRGAGTVEFLFSEGEFYFLEMNTRIQVEHPVTELVTDVDLVREQIRIAGGAEMEWDPDPAWPRGHALECRISGEDPSGGFLPSAGRIGLLEVPSGPGVRWDGGIGAGFEVGLHYDPLLGKLIVHAPTRDAAIGRMRRALEELVITGVATTQPYHLAVMEESDFRGGRLSVAYVDEHPELLRAGPGEERITAAAVAAALLEEERRARLRGRPPAAAETGTDGPRPAGGAPAENSVRPRRSADGRSAWQRAFDPR